MIPVGILVGGKGTRLSEETVVKPKPMVEIGGKPILWHIMKIYAHYGFTEFYLALGYKGDMVRDYVKTLSEPWTIHCLETGEETLTAGRVGQIMRATRKMTMITYGDGVANIDLHKLVAHHLEVGCMATVTAVAPPSRFGRIRFDGDHRMIQAFDEKPVNKNAYDGEFINGGFFVVNSNISQAFDLDNDENFEQVYLPLLVKMCQLSGYVHRGFWQCMDTLRDKDLLNELWLTGPKWKVWRD